jgi:iron complex transport system substrate-binding protein
MKYTAALILLIMLAAGCGRFTNEDKKEDHKERIVCLAKQYNEIIYALGAQQDLVAVDLSSTYPAEIKELPTVGYHRALSAEAIIAARPTIIIHDNNIGPEPVVKQLEQLKVPMLVFKSKGEDIGTAKDLIREMGVYFHRESKADSLCKKLDLHMAKALEKAKQYADTPKVVIIHFGRASNIYLTMTQNGTAGKLIGWAGGKIPVEGEKGMVQISPEIIASANPDVILLTDFGYDRLGTIQKIKELPGVASTNAARNGRIYRVEEHDMVYIGPRTGENVLKLQQLIHGKGETK